MRFLIVVLMLGILAGCVTQRVTPVSGISAEQICIVRNRAVKAEFAEIYAEQIRRNGYSAIFVESREEASACLVTSTYSATWGFHWGEYLATTDIRVFKGDEMVGQAVYKAPYASPAKHGRIAPKIEGLVNQLFPPKMQ